MKENQELLSLTSLGPPGQLPMVFYCPPGPE